MKRKSCLICQNTKLIKIIDLGNHAYADTFISQDRLHERLSVYKLGCELCPNCGQIQTVSKTSPDERYGLHDYSYTSSNSAVSRKHWKKYADRVAQKAGINQFASVVEIGSNDGYLLKQFKNKGCETLGVDASEHMSQIATRDGVYTLNLIFNEDVVDNVKAALSSLPNLVMANNVFNHSDNPLSFAVGVNKLLKNSGYFVFELPYWKCSIESMKIDQIYHEHVSYFTVKSAAAIMKKSGFKILDIEIVDYHGGSLRVFAQKTNNIQHADIVHEMIEQERFLFKKKTYVSLMNNFNHKKYRFVANIMRLKNLGENIVAIGAAAKGNTFLNFLNLDKSIIDFVTDISKHKQGKYTPLTSIPIVSDNTLKQYERVYALILSWNISDKLKSKLKEINPEIEFLDFYENNEI